MVAHLQKYLVLFLVSSCLPFIGYSQAGNEWIDYSQPYWKFKIAADGVYRISYNSLVSGGLPVTSISPQNIRMYARGKEISIKFSGDEDGAIGPGDYIEFYGQKNDAWLDSLTYNDPNHVCNPNYSLFNDTIHYFLTVNNDPGSLRCTTTEQTNFNDYTPVPYCSFQSAVDFHSRYLIGKQDVNGISLPTYDEAEGWFDAPFAKGTARHHDIPTPHVYSGPDAPPVKVFCVSAGASMAQGSPNHHLQLGWGNPINIEIDTSYNGYQLNRLAFNINPSNLTGTTTRITHRSIDDLNVVTDLNAVSYIRITYPRNFIFDNIEPTIFNINNYNQNEYLLLNITGYSESARLFVLKNGLHREVVTGWTGGVLSAIVPTSGADIVRILVIEPEHVQEITSISPVSTSGYFTDYVAQDLSNSFLIITHPLLWPAALNYSVYRNTAGSNSLLVNVEELYMQYAAGIYKHPLAIRRFCLDALQSSQSPPAHLFIIGKSIHEATFSATIGARNDPVKFKNNLVPTWGYQGSDLVFTAGIFGTISQPAIPTGRLAAQNIQQVQEYLNKIVEFENQEPASWQKNILHFGGGGNAFEQGLFRNYLNNYSVIAGDTCFGGRVSSFFKNTLEPIQINVSDSIQLLINEGASLMTFFGHASSSGFDQNIDSPQSYNNQGKYPLLIGNSCYTGNVNLSDANSASENFVLTPNRGVIGFLAKSDLGIPTYLNIYTDNFYRAIFNYNYGSTIGQCMKKAIENFQIEGDFYRTNAALTFSLHGDPSVKLYPWEKPDYSITASSILFDPPQVTSANSTFSVSVIIENIGKAVNAPVGVELVRRYPDGTDTSYVIVLNRIIGVDTVVFNLETDPLKGTGLNTFDVFVDYPTNLVNELDDIGNNIVLNKTLLISSGELLPVYPFRFSIIDNSQPVLKASTGNPLEPAKRYIIQADTSHFFNSPMLHSTQIEQTGGVVEWMLPWQLTTSDVVFWRCSPDSISPQESYSWRESSFQFREGLNGWGQKYYYQFDDNLKVNINQNTDNLNWEFSPTEVDLKCEVYGSANTTFESLSTRYQLDLDVQEYGGFGFNSPALMVAVLDSATFIPWETNFNGANPQNNFGNTMASSIARNRTERYFIFQQNSSTQLDGFADMVTSAVPDGNFLLIYTWLFAQQQNWADLSPSVADAFTALGAEQILEAQDSLPFIFFVKKGHPETRQLIIGAAPDSYLVLERNITGSTGSAIVKSPVIGPGYDWSNANWNISSSDIQEGDTTRIKLYGIDDVGYEVLIANWNAQDQSSQALGEVAGISQFSRLRLEAELKDQVFYTAPQLNNWEILYREAPECAINPHRAFFLSADTLQEGEKLKVAVAIENISSHDMDSLLVSYVIEDQEKNRHPINYPRQSPLIAGGYIIDTLEINTSGFAGFNRLLIEANAKNVLTGLADQPEQYDFNNILQIPFWVVRDNINPVLEITADGRHILNGEIISARPEITITIDDENPYFIMNEEADTSRVRIYLSTPIANDIPVYFSGGELSFTPATAPKNKFKVDYRPMFSIDGKYKLRVQATDKRGNPSGLYDYEINFEVVNKPGITEMMNYPNPFTTSTRFVFTVTGSQPPDQIKIQIMTVGGKIVREITQDELGPIYIGRNITDYSWDGTDEYGDRLANGVYLYRVMTRLGGNDLEIIDSGADTYFTKGFGKMYLFR